MRYLIGERHRRIIIEHLPAGGRMLEWGSGTSTVWFAEHLPADATLLSIEHDREWFGRVRSMLAGHDCVGLRCHPPAGILGPNASVGEERPDLLRDYIHAADADGAFDVILVDGVARDACLEHARALLKPGGTIFLHDAQRPWYDRGKLTHEAHGHCGSCPDYPGPHLWWGGINAPSGLALSPHHAGEMPLVVGYYTVGTGYEDEARQLIESLDALGLEHRVEALPVSGTWIKNCGRKARVIQRAWRETGRPVLWLDADARAHRAPTLLANTTADFAIRCFHGWAFGTGTVFFARTPLAGMLLDDWVHRVDVEPGVGEQIHLDKAWEAMSCRTELRTLWLPPSYATIFDEPGRDQTPAVIEHFQASRRLAPQQQSAERVEVHHTAARVARLARRPREELVSHTWRPPDVAQPPPPVPSPARPPSGVLPEHVKRGLADRVALELVMSGVQRVALYGAGRFAREVVLPVLIHRGVRVLCIADDHQSGEFDGIEVVRPEAAAARPGIEAVVISSDAYEDALADKAGTVFIGAPVLRVIEWQANRQALRTTRTVA
jgi:hypothetical protein